MYIQEFQIVIIFHIPITVSNWRAYTGLVVGASSGEVKATSASAEAARAIRAQYFKHEINYSFPFKKNPG